MIVTDFCLAKGERNEIRADEICSQLVADAGYVDVHAVDGLSGDVNSLFLLPPYKNWERVPEDVKASLRELYRKRLTDLTAHYAGPITGSNLLDSAVSLWLLDANAEQLQLATRVALDAYIRTRIPRMGDRRLTGGSSIFVVDPAVWAFDPSPGAEEAESWRATPDGAQLALNDTGALSRGNEAGLRRLLKDLELGDWDSQAQVRLAGTNADSPYEVLPGNVLDALRAARLIRDADRAHALLEYLLEIAPFSQEATEAAYVLNEWAVLFNLGVSRFKKAEAALSRGFSMPSPAPTAGAFLGGSQDSIDYGLQEMLHAIDALSRVRDGGLLQSKAREYLILAVEYLGQDVLAELKSAFSTGRVRDPRLLREVINLIAFGTRSTATQVIGLDKWDCSDFTVLATRFALRRDSEDEENFARRVLDRLVNQGAQAFLIEPLTSNSLQELERVLLSGVRRASAENVMRKLVEETRRRYVQSVRENTDASGIANREEAKISYSRSFEAYRTALFFAARLASRYEEIDSLRPSRPTTASATVVSRAINGMTYRDLMHELLDLTASNPQLVYAVSSDFLMSRSVLPYLRKRSLLEDKEYLIRIRDIAAAAEDVALSDDTQLTLDSILSEQPMAPQGDLPMNLLVWRPVREHFFSANRSGQTVFSRRSTPMFAAEIREELRRLSLGDTTREGDRSRRIEELLWRLAHLESQ